MNMKNHAKEVKTKNIKNNDGSASSAVWNDDGASHIKLAYIFHPTLALYFSFECRAHTRCNSANASLATTIACIVDKLRKKM